MSAPHPDVIRKQDVRAAGVESPLSKFRPAGHVEIEDEWGEVIRGDTLQCVHCGGHFVVIKGSGRRRGWCMVCDGPTCGEHRCDTCTPLERRLENLEAGRPADRKPIHGAVPDTVRDDDPPKLILPD